MTLSHCTHWELNDVEMRKHLNWMQYYHWVTLNPLFLILYCEHLLYFVAAVLAS